MAKQVPSFCARVVGLGARGVLEAARGGLVDLGGLEAARGGLEALEAAPEVSEALPWLCFSSVHDTFS